MANPKTVSWAQLRVGILAIVSMMILGVLIFLLTGSGDLFSRQATIHTFMADSSGMAKGAAVRLDGILVGSIGDPKLSGERDPKKLVEIPMLIRSEFLQLIPDDSIAAISASNLLGDKFINITTGKSKTPVKDGGTLQALQARDIPELMTQSANMLEDFQKVVKRVDGILADVEAGKGNVGKLLRDEELFNNANNTVLEVQKAVKAVNSGKGLANKLLYDDQLYQDVRATIQRVNNLIAAVERGEGTAGKLLKDTAVYDEARKSLTEIRTMLEGINAGRGTAGKLVKDDKLYQQVNQLVSKIDTTIDRLNEGKGTLGQLMVNPQLYESLNGFTGEMQSLVKDVRANPKKFLRIKLAIF